MISSVTIVFPFTTAAILLRAIYSFIETFVQNFFSGWVNYYFQVVTTKKMGLFSRSLLRVPLASLFQLFMLSRCFFFSEPSRFRTSPPSKKHVSYSSRPCISTYFLSPYGQWKWCWPYASIDRSTLLPPAVPNNIFLRNNNQLLSRTPRSLLSEWNGLRDYRPTLHVAHNWLILPVISTKWKEGCTCSMHSLAKSPVDFITIPHKEETEVVSKGRRNTPLPSLSFYRC